MKNLFFLSLIVLFFLSGCSEKLKSPVEPNVIYKGVLANYSFTGTPLGIVDPGTSRIAGNHIIFNNLIVRGRVNCDNQMINGIIEITNNREFTLLTGEGQMHGTLTLTPDVHPDGEYWAGTFTGTRVKTGENEWTNYIRQNAAGHNGSIEGLHFYVESILIHNDIWGDEGYVSYGTGYIR